MLKLKNIEWGPNNLRGVARHASSMLMQPKFDTPNNQGICLSKIILLPFCLVNPMPNDEHEHWHFLFLFFSLVIRGVFSFLKQVHKQEWKFVVYLKKCLSNVRTHGPFWQWNAHSIVVKSFYPLFQIGLAFFHWFNLLPLPFWNVGLRLLLQLSFVSSKIIIFFFLCDGICW
jgi:hypothetical protein